jgi:sugar phosphate isomerase/epimerase
VNRLGIDRLSVFGMPPVEFVTLVSDLGCGWVGMGLAPSGSYNPHGYPAWSLRDDAALRRVTRQVLAETGVRVGLFEGFGVFPGQDPRSFEQDLDLVAELGGRRINLVSLDKDLSRTIDGFAKFAEMAAARGLMISAEMGSLGPSMGRIDTALATMHAVGSPHFNLLIDTMHWFRLGNTVEQFAAMPAGALGYVQLCDVPLAPRFATYMEEAMYERMSPGDGELPLADFLRATPADVVVSLELPQRSLAQQGVGPHDRLRPCVAAARALLESPTIN